MTEFTHEELLSPRHAAERLADIAYALTAGETLELRARGARITLPVADQVLLMRATRTSGDRVNVEVRLTWSAEATGR